MEADDLRTKAKNSIKDTELSEEDRESITEEAKVTALLYHALIAYGIPAHLAGDLTRDYFNSRLGCEGEQEDTVPVFDPNRDGVVGPWRFTYG